MKSRIGTINKKPIVQGDKNLVTPNEIHVSELKGGGQGNAPVEYYKVVALEGENLDDVTAAVPIYIDTVFSYFSFHILIKGTSSSSLFKSYTGIDFLFISTFDNFKIYAYAVMPLEVPGKKMNSSGELFEFLSFNNIFDALESLGEPGEQSLSYLREHLVPITAEEFYSLDDLK